MYLLKVKLKLDNYGYNVFDFYAFQRTGQAWNSNGLSNCLYCWMLNSHKAPSIVFSLFYFLFVIFITRHFYLQAKPKVRLFFTAGLVLLIFFPGKFAAEIKTLKFSSLKFRTNSTVLLPV